MEKYHDLTKAQFQALLQDPVNGPLQMLNLLKFKTTVSETGKTGAQQYKSYMAAALPFFEKTNAKILYYGEAQLTLIGPENDLEWDKIIIVEYATKSDFINMITSEGYPADLRKLALEDSRLIFCTPVK